MSFLELQPKHAIGKMIWYTLIIVAYEIITSQIASWGITETLGGVFRIYVGGKFATLSELDVLFYTIMGLKIIDAWIDGMLMTIINISVIIFLYAWIFRPFGTIGIQFGIENIAALTFTAQIGYLFLFVLGVYGIFMAFDVAKFMDHKNDMCFMNVGFEQQKVSNSDIAIAKAYFTIHNKDGSPIASAITPSKKPAVASLSKKEPKITKAAIKPTKVAVSKARRGLLP